MISSLWQRLVRGTRRVEAGSGWPEAAGADWADRIMAVEPTDDFHAKQGRSTGRWVAGRKGRRLSVYLKRHYRLPWWRGLLATLFPRGAWSPARQEWGNLSWARAQGFRVPAPLAVA